MIDMIRETKPMNESSFHIVKRIRSILDELMRFVAFNSLLCIFSSSIGQFSPKRLFVNYMVILRDNTLFRFYCDDLRAFDIFWWIWRANFHCATSSLCSNYDEIVAREFEIMSVHWIFHNFVFHSLMWFMLQNKYVSNDSFFTLCVQV